MSEDAREALKAVACALQALIAKDSLPLAKFAQAHDGIWPIEVLEVALDQLATLQAKLDAAEGEIERLKSDVDFIIDVSANELSYSEQTGPRAEDIKKALRDYLAAHPFDKDFAAYVQAQAKGVEE